MRFLTGEKTNNFFLISDLLDGGDREILIEDDALDTYTPLSGPHS